MDKPDSVTQCVRRTMAQSVDLLATLFEGEGQEVDLATARALAVDDQQIALRSVMHALEKANLKSQALSDPSAGFSVAQEWQFDLIVLDHEMPGMTGVVQDAGVPLRPSISIRQSRHEPNALMLSVAQSFGISVPISIAARMIDVPSGTVTLCPSIVSVTSFEDFDSGVP